MPQDRLTALLLVCCPLLTRVLGALAGLCVLSSCASNEGHNGGSWDVLGSPIIYGEDDRVEALMYPDSVLVTRARTTLGALIPSQYVSQRSDGTFALVGPTLSELHAVCADEPFATQPSLAMCSAIVVDENTILTAGHCVPKDLQGTLFVQGYALTPDLQVIDASQVHSLSHVIAEQNGDLTNDSAADFALLAVTSPITPAAPLFSAHTPALEVNDPVAVIGTSEGLPLKIEAGGRVFALPLNDTFEITSDTFQGGSGSGVFSPSGTFLGMLIGGAPDYEWDAVRACYARIHLDIPTDRGEIIVSAEHLKAEFTSEAEANAVLPAEANCSMSSLQSAPARSVAGQSAAAPFSTMRYLPWLCSVGLLYRRRKARAACSYANS